MPSDRWNQTLLSLSVQVKGGNYVRVPINELDMERVDHRAALRSTIKRKLGARMPAGVPFNWVDQALAELVPEPEQPRLDDDELVETRAEDRDEMTRRVYALAEELGVDASPGSLDGHDKERQVAITVGPYRVTADFDGRSQQPNVFVLSWHVGAHAQEGCTFPKDFGDVNPHHQRKATRVARGFAVLLDVLREDIATLQKHLAA